MIDIALLVDGMNDVTFTLKDVIFIVGGASSVIMVWNNLRAKISDQGAGFANDLTKVQLEYFKMEDKFKDLEKAVEERFINAKGGRIAIKKELHENLTRLESDFKEYRTKSDAEFKEINGSLAYTKATVKAIDGKLDALITLLKDDKQSK